MLGSIGGNSGFDQFFLAFFFIMPVIWLIALSLFRRLSIVTALFFWALASVGLVTIPIYWYDYYPPSSGIESAGRLIFLVPLALLNLSLAIIFLVKIVRRKKSGKYQ